LLVAQVHRELVHCGVLFQEDRPFLVEWVLAVERPHPFGIVVLVAFRDSSIGVDDDAHTMLARGMIADPAG
jgi:hypothetical protein